MNPRNLFGTLLALSCLLAASPTQAAGASSDPSSVVTGWRVGRDGVWRAQLDGTNGVSQLYVNGRRRERPFLPRQGCFRVCESGPQENAGEPQVKFVYPDGALNHCWPDLDQVEIRVFHNQGSTCMRIKEIDPVRHVVTLTGLDAKNGGKNAFSSPSGFRAENVRAAFGEPGDWYLTPERELWYRPFPDETPEGTKVTAVANAGESPSGDGLCQGQAGALQFGDAGATIPVTVDFDKVIGKIRPELHSSGFGAQICSCPSQTIAEVKSMGFKASRTHDWAKINPGQRVCDYFFIFPLMKKDATDPENYVFGPTDYLLKRTREELGHDIFFRLGTSIEHSGVKVHFNAAIPTDFDKMAEIFAGTVRHYNCGWANGFNWDIRYWEIWNEPDGTINMWCLPEGDLAEKGDRAGQARLDEKRRALFIRFYVKVLKRLKDEFGDTIKVGGPAMCWMDRKYFRALLGACREAGVAPDFISWHHYAEDPMVIADAIRTGRALCDEFGFTKCELVINEWHYFSFSDYDWGDLRSPDPVKMSTCWEGPRAHNGIDSSCFNLAVLSQMQTSVLDQGFYYGCRNSGNWGYKDEFQRKFKVYYGLKMFGDLLKVSDVLCATTVPPANGVPVATALATKSRDGRRKSLLIVDYRTRASAVCVKVAGVGARARVRAVVHDGRHDVEPIAASFVGGQLMLKKSDQESAAFLVSFED